MSAASGYLGNLNEHQVAAVDAMLKLRGAIADGNLTITDLLAAVEHGVDDGGIHSLDVAMHTAAHVVELAAENAKVKEERAVEAKA